MKQKEKEIHKSDVKCENLSCNLKKVKDELSSLKQERRKYFKKKLVNHEEASESNNNSVKTIESGLGLATTDQPPRSRSSSLFPRAQSTQTPPRTPPPSTYPNTVNTPAPASTSALTSATSGTPTQSGEASIDEIDNLDVVNPQSAVSVQAKLKEARDSGTKLDFQSLVVLLENHQWEESPEKLENDAEDDNFYYDYYTDHYEETIDEK